MSDDVTREDVRRTLQRVEAMAADEDNPDKAATIRQVRVFVETDLLSDD